MPTGNDCDPEVGRPRPKVPAEPLEEQSVEPVDDQRRVTVAGTVTLIVPRVSLAKNCAVGSWVHCGALY